jgi:hypothetical protein
MKAAAESAEILVYDRDFPLRWGQARKNHQTERFPHTKTVPAALLDFDDADKRIGWIDQIESHSVYSFMVMEELVSCLCSLLYFKAPHP